MVYFKMHIFQQVIFNSAKDKSSTYLIGWDEQPESHCERFTGADADCHTMGGLRASAEVDDIQVYTIDSHHNDIPEVAYLVRHGNWIVYHNGDYMADHVEDYAYLKTISDRIDLAFVAGLSGSQMASRRLGPCTLLASLLCRCCSRCTSAIERCVRVSWPRWQRRM